MPGYEPLLLVIPFMHLEILHRSLPSIRLEGYYIVSDLTGVPDMFARIRPTLASLLPWKRTSERVTELKPWVRAVVTAYVFTVVPLLLLMFGLMLMNAPRIISTAYDSFFVQYHKVEHAFNGGSALNGVIGILQMLILILPVLGIAATVWMVFRRVTGAVWSRTEGKPAVRAAYGVVSATAVAALGYVWWPNGDYRPIQRGERGTLTGAVQELAQVPSGRPSLTRQRAQQLHGAPLQSSTHQQTTPQPPGSQPRTPTTSTPTVTNQTPTTTTTDTTKTETTTTPTTTSVTTTTPTVTTP